MRCAFETSYPRERPEKVDGSANLSSSAQFAEKRASHAKRLIGKGLRLRRKDGSCDDEITETVDPFRSMKVRATKFDEAEVRKAYPIGDRVPGWFFRCEEQSNDVWRAEGTDLWGRTVGATDSDDVRVLDQCIRMAEDINAQLAAAKARNSN